MQEANKSNRLAASGEVLYTHIRTLAASIYKHISLPFRHIIQCEPQCVLGSSFPELEIPFQELDVCP